MPSTVPPKWTDGQTHRQMDGRTDISTYRKHRPRKPMLWKTSCFIKLELYLIFSLCFYAQNKPKILKLQFHAVFNNPINKITMPPKNNLRRSKIEGGSWERYCGGHWFNLIWQTPPNSCEPRLSPFCLKSLLVYWICNKLFSPCA